MHLPTEARQLAFIDMDHFERKVDFYFQGTPAGGADVKVLVLGRGLLPNDCFNGLSSPLAPKAAVYVLIVWAGTARGPRKADGGPALRLLLWNGLLVTEHQIAKALQEAPYIANPCPYSTVLGILAQNPLVLGTDVV